MKRDDLIRKLDDWGDRLTAVAPPYGALIVSPEGEPLGQVPHLDPLIDDVRQLAHDLRFEEVEA